MKRITLHKTLMAFTYLIFLGVSTLLILELCFRFQIIEFYGVELNGLNSEIELSSNKKNILVIGDSFSAHPQSYVRYLRANYPECNFINAAIPGTGIKQHNLIIQKRIKQFKPTQIIYQFYLGNDFADIDHPKNFRTISLARNIYWIVSEYILFLHYANYKLAFLKPQIQSISEIHEPEFSPDKYNQRVQTYFNGDPNYLTNTILLEGKQKDTWRQWKNEFSNFQENIPDSIPVSFILIPHCAQVSPVYAKRMQLIGANIPREIHEPNFSLIAKMQEEIVGVHFINPLSDLQNAEQTGTQLYYSNDPHFNFEGQKHLGNFLSQNLNFIHEQ